MAANPSVIYLAVVIGINYTGTSAALSGCVNDAIEISNYLKSRSFPHENIHVMTDNKNVTTLPELVPTRKNIFHQFDWIVEKTKPAEDNLNSYVVFFSFSGHGGRIRDQNGDEIDGRDETLLPLDYVESGEILDDEIRIRFLNRLKSNVTLFALVDSCHSGTAFDLRCVGALSFLKQPNLFSSLQQNKTAVLSQQKSKPKVIKPYSYGTISKLFGKKPLKPIQPPSKEQATLNTTTSKYVWNIQSKYAPTEARVIMISGCRDDQFSADTFEDGRACGALTCSFLTILSKNSQKSIESIYELTKDLLQQKKYSQIPQLSAGNEKNVKVSDPFPIF